MVCTINTPTCSLQLAVQAKPIVIACSFSIISRTVTPMTLDNREFGNDHRLPVTVIPSRGCGDPVALLSSLVMRGSLILSPIHENSASPPQTH